MRRPKVTWFSPTEGNEDGPVTVNAPELVAAFGDGLVLASMRIAPDGTWQLSWSCSIAETRPLPDVELFVAKVASFIVDEPVERAGDDDPPADGLDAPI